MLLEPQLLDRLERLALSSSKRVASGYPGQHRARALGASVDFADWRQYMPGDDFRRIDYQIYARLDKLVVRLFEAEEEIVLRVLLDASGSMGFHDKLPYAARVAGALCYVAACRKDRARVWTMDAGGVRPGPWARSTESALVLFNWLEGVQAGGNSNLPEALRRLSPSANAPGITAVVSDLMSPQWEDTIRALGRPGHEGVLIHILSGPEKDPAERGDLQLVDAESGAEVDVSLSEQALRQYGERLRRWLQAVSLASRRRGVQYLLVDPADPLGDVLLKRLPAQGLLG